MKMFEFDPTTGRRGELLDNVKLISWTDASVDYAVKNGTLMPIDYSKPGSTKTSQHTAHIDAGYTNRHGVHCSYRQRDKWVTFCMGEMISGFGAGIWEWIILPPANLIEHT